MFQRSETDVVVVERGDVVRSRSIEGKFCIEDIQVDADAAAVADGRDLICFFCLSDRCFGSADLFFIREDIQVILTDFQLDLFSRLQECFLCCFDRGIRFLHRCLGSAAIPKRPGKPALNSPVIFIDRRHTGFLPAVCAADADCREIACLCRAKRSLCCLYAIVCFDEFPTVFLRHQNGLFHGEVKFRFREILIQRVQRRIHRDTHDVVQVRFCDITGVVRCDALLFRISK